MQSLQLPQQSVQLLQQSLIFCNWNQFRLASPALKSDRDFILEGLNVHGWGPKIYQNISRELKADREIVRSAVCHDVDVLGYAVFEAVAPARGIQFQNLDLFPRSGLRSAKIK